MPEQSVPIERVVLVLIGMRVDGISEETTAFGWLTDLSDWLSANDGLIDASSQSLP